MVTKTQVQETNTEAEKLSVNQSEDLKGQLEQPPKDVEERDITSLDKAVAHVHTAYTRYKEAERYVAKLYKKSEEQVTSQHRKRERKSQVTCDDNIREALKAREAAEEQGWRAHQDRLSETWKLYARHLDSDSKDYSN
jgi:hypothetical protein